MSDAHADYLQVIDDIKRAGHTQRDIAQMLGVREETMSRRITGKVRQRGKISREALFAAKWLAYGAEDKAEL